MFIKLILNNWKAQPSKFAIIFSALTIGLTLMTLLTALNAGLKNYYLSEGNREEILRELNVQPKGNKLELNLVSLIPQPKLTPETIEAIKKIPEVVEVLPSNTIQGISSVQIGILGQWFQTDALLYGAPYELLNNNVQKADWTDNNLEPYPVVVSSKLVDLYNYSFASANNLPQLTAENFIGTEINILLNKSTFFAQDTGEIQTLHAKVVGFSPNVKLIGLTLPLESIDRINKNILKKTEQYYLDANIHVKSPSDLGIVQNKLEAMGLNVTAAEKSLKSLEGLFTVTDISLNFFFAIMMLMVGLLISSNFLAKIAEKSREIAILKTLGLTNNKISQLYLIEASLIGLIASICGVIIGIILSIPLEPLLSLSIKTLLNKPNQFFLFHPLTLIELIIFTIFIASAFAYFPAKKAAKLDPAQLLTR